MARRLKYVEIKNELTGERLCILETEWRLTRNAVDAMFDSSIGTEKVPSDAGYVFVHPFKVTAREA